MNSKIDNCIKLGENGYNICFGTGIATTKLKGLKGLIKKIKLYVLVFFNINRKQNINNLQLPKVLKTCIKNNCYAFDTSRAYGYSEYVIGEVIKNVDRKKIYIITKLDNYHQYKEDVVGSIKKSLEELNTNYIDLYLMHWPVKDHFINSWKCMEKLYKDGKCKAIGVCNFSIHHFEELKIYAEIMPMFNEIECHPLFTQNELREYCKKNNIRILSYTSTARMDERLKKTCLVQIAKKYNKSIAQIILRWHQQIGNIPIVNTVSEKHMVDNININDFYLTNEEISDINAININSRLRYDPDNCDFKQL